MLPLGEQGAALADARSMTLATVGGYRLVRKLGEGARAVTWLGHPLDDSAPAAVKLYRSADAVPPADELAALARAAGPHVVGVLDVATSTDGRVALILERLRSESLATLLAARGSMRPGEAVTVLAPIAQALERMHRAGVTHGAVRPSAIGFTEHGAPVLACFGSAVATSGAPTAASRDSDPAVAVDRAAFLELAADVLGAIPGSGAVLEWIAAESGSSDCLERVGARLFSWAAPQPVEFGRMDAAPPRPVEPAPRRPRGRSQPALAALDRVASALSGDRLAWLREHVKNVRPRFWVVGGGATIALVLAVALVPSLPGTGESEALEPPHPVPSATVSVEPALAAITGDDPVAAARVLLETRERCIRELSILCLDAVAQSGSVALTTDQELIRAIQSGAVPPQPWAIDDVVVEERLGGTALLTVSTVNGEPASILLMRSEAGWRIRDYVDAG